jgi:pimeloyl-ACP methyl ester carboxylesterase
LQHIVTRIFVSVKQFTDLESTIHKISIHVEVIMLLRKASLLGLMILLLGISIIQAAPAQSTAEILEQLGGYPCPDSDFTCVKLSVPLDHFAEETSETIDVVFGVLPATGERKGMFVTVTGGPGTTGLASADSYTAAFDPAIPEHFDIVFFDQRGAVQSGNIQCQQAVLTYYSKNQLTETPEQEAQAIEDAKTFAEDCVKEMGIPVETLPYYATTQAIEDLEAFREIIGDEKFWLYGESYGTQYAQTYAAAHTDHLAGLILDGTVDLTLSIDAYYQETAQTFNDVFIWLMEDCNEDEACAADVVGGDLLAFYDDLMAELATSPITFQFPLGSGETIERSLTRAQIEYAVSNYFYSEGDRQILQRALTAASQGNFIPLAHVVYNAYTLDPDTLTVTPDPTYSDAMFYAVECNDYSISDGTPEEKAETYMRAGDQIDTSVPRAGSFFYGDLPCAFWPTEAPVERPAPLVAEGVPTLVLGATADVYTPVGNGERVYENLDDGYLITTDGGAHITYGWGNACPDEIVVAFLAEDQMPDERETRCEGTIADDYVANAPAEAASYADPLEALNAVYNEIYYTPQYYYWDGETSTSMGCVYGGSFTFEATDEGQEFQFNQCAFSKGFAMTGTGLSSDGVSDFALDVEVSGDAEGTLSYVYDGEGTTVSGDYAGEAVDLTG